MILGGNADTSSLDFSVILDEDYYIRLYLALPDVLQSGGQSSDSVKFFPSSGGRCLSFNFGKCSCSFLFAHRATLTEKKLKSPISDIEIW